MIRKFVDRLEEEYGTLIWRHYCKLKYARTQKDFWDAIKALAKIIDAIL